MLENLSHFGVEEGRASISEARAALMSVGPDVEPENCFGLLLIDGMCRREEAVISALYSALDDMPSSAARPATAEIREDLDDPRRRAYSGRGGAAAGDDGSAVQDRSTAIISSRRRSRWWSPRPTPSFGWSSELNAEPAAKEYARQSGILDGSLDAFSFASHPVLVGVGGQYFVRSIQQVNPTAR